MPRNADLNGIIAPLCDMFQNVNSVSSAFACRTQKLNQSESIQLNYNNVVLQPKSKILTTSHFMEV